MLRAVLLSLALLGSLPVAALADTAVPTPDCAALTGGPMIEARLFFGRNIGDRLGVSQKAWARFVDREVTPRFPDGLTVQDASGQWRDSATGRLVREPSKILTLLVGADAELAGEDPGDRPGLQGPLQAAGGRHRAAPGLRWVLMGVLMGVRSGADCSGVRQPAAPPTF